MVVRRALAGSLLLTVAASADEVKDRQRIFEELTGGVEPTEQRTRSIVVEPAFNPRSDQSVYMATSLPAIQFEHDSARLTAAARRQLAELGGALGMPPLDQARFAIQGHTDSRGSAAYNRNLSRERANSVTRFLVRESGVADRRLTAVGVGEDMPVEGLAPADPRNRRVEVIRLGADPAYRPAGGSEAAVDARALLVGIDDYATLHSLLGAPINDVAAMRRYVENGLGYHPEHVRTLLDGEATHENILNGIRDWLLGGDRALLYFSGHGYQQPDANGDEADGFDETLIPYDVTVENGIVRGMIADDEIDTLIARADIPVEVVIDSCHSGTATRSVGLDEAWRFVKSPRTPDGAPLRRGGGTRGIVAEPEPRGFVDGDRANVAVWSAVQAEQKALVDIGSGPRYRSVFTHRLLSGLDGAADGDASGIVTAAELEAYVRRESEAHCESHPNHCSHGLTPDISVPPGRTDASAFARVERPVVSVASLAKDLLVSPRAADADELNALRLSLEPGSELRVGQTIELSVESKTGGSLVLLDIDAEGRMTQVFPNDWSDSAMIAAGVPQRVPGEQAGFRLRAQPPVGRGWLVAVVTDGELPGTLTSLHKDLSVIARPDAYVVELAGQLRRAETGSWGYAALPYQIVAL